MLIKKQMKNNIKDKSDVKGRENFGRIAVDSDHNTCFIFVCFTFCY